MPEITMPPSHTLSEFAVWAKQRRTHVLARQAASQIEKANTIYLLAPSSFLGLSFTIPVAQRLRAAGKRVALVDDTLATPPPDIADCTVLSTRAFVQENPSAGLAINMANTVFVHGLFCATALRANIPVIDIVAALDYFELPVIYQTASAMRDATLARLDDYVTLAGMLDDDLSVQTLRAALEMRITMNREAVLPVLCSLEDEYFSPYPTGKDVTFALGAHEILCDVGAHVGTTVRKFLTATHWQYDAIHAFEPDAGNYAALRQGVFEALPNFHPRNIALSNSKSTLGFSETGTMGSRLDANGNVQVQASTLDDEVAHATFIKMDVEGHEANILRGARRLIAQSKPRLAITGYHFANDLLDIVQLVREIEPAYRLRLRHHSFYYYDTILYADIAP